MSVNGFGAAADHAALTGLTVGDPHTQYTLKTDVASLANAVSLSGGSRITASGAAIVPLAIRAAASQTGNLLEFQDSTGAVISHIGPLGGYNGAGATLTGTDPAAVHFTIKGAAGQTANLAEWQDSAGAVVAAIGPTGEPRGTLGSYRRAFLFGVS